MASEKTFKDLDLTNDEVKRLGEALKDEKFRKMFAEYAEEISDPENRRKAEEEITQMENERGMNVQFIHPTPGYVLKTIVDGSTKAFINICQNEKVEKPSSKSQTGPDGKRGLMWQIPHSFAPPRDDLDKSKSKCKVFDVVFHPDTYRMATSNERFRKLVEDTALDGIEQQFGVTLDKKNFKRPKLNFKGQPVATVIRERKSDITDSKIDSDSILNKMPYPYGNTSSSEKAAMKETSQTNGVSENHTTEENRFTKPKYTITHRSKLDMGDYRNAPDAKTSTRPNELIIKIDLPLLKSATELNLDIFEKKIVLESTVPAAYKLDINLPFPVNDEEGSAKFDKSKRTLTVTLPVIPEVVPSLPFGHKGDGDSIGNDKSESSSELISVMQESSNKESEKSPRLDSLTQPKESPKPSGEGSFPQNVKWLLPEYQVSQDSETLSFVLKVTSVDENSIVLRFIENTGVQIKFISVGAGCFPSYYSLTVNFASPNLISPSDCNVDVSDDNLVLLILKDKSCRELWDSYHIGLEKDSLEAKQFLTEGNLKRDLCALDEESEKDSNVPGEEEDLCNIAVLEMQAEKLTIEIKPKEKSEEGKDDEEESSEMPPPVSIEVVHRRPAPALHSILKQRTVSESSEDHSMASSNPNIDSIEEESNSGSDRRRTVSFNSRIDQASFKSNASVTSLTNTLKSKRKKHRKREEKQRKLERRRQRKLSGSSVSSGDENHLRESLSDSHSMSEEEESEVKGTSLQRSVSDPGPSSEEVGDEIFDSQDKDLVNGSSGDNSEKSEILQNEFEVLDFRTKESDKCCEENVIGDSERAIDKCSEKWNEKVTKEIKGKLTASKNESGRDEGCDSDDDDEEYVDVNVEGKGHCNGSGDKNDEKSICTPKDKRTEKSDVETMLSWEEGPRENDAEHTTTCAVQFSNTVMYDLDVD